MSERFEPVESPDETTVFPYHDLTPPTPADVHDAKRVVHRYLPRTPLVKSEYLSHELNADVYLKREDTLPTGAFKVRGGVNLVHALDSTFRSAGLIAASTGNHGQSIAYAGRLFNVPVTIAVPSDPNPKKVAAMEAFGAQVEAVGKDYDEAREWAEQTAAEEQLRYVHSANEPMLVAGVGTAGLEVIDDLPTVDTIVCPVGGGSSAAGYCLTTGHALNADVIGVQAAGASAMYRAWHESHLAPQDAATSFAEGINSRVPFALTMDVLRDRLADMVTVSDEAIGEALVAMYRNERIIIEGASAAAVAAALKNTDALEEETVVIQLSGRNVSDETLERLLNIHE